MYKPNCPDCGKKDDVVRLDNGDYACKECGDIFNNRGQKIPKR